MQTVRFLLNRAEVVETVPAGMPLLDVIRRRRHLTGCKQGCGEGDCGACLVLLGKLEQGGPVYRPAAACLLPMGAVSGCHVVTIEGLSAEKPNPIQQALVEEGGIQCGFCTPGLVVALTAFFLNHEAADAEAALDAVAGNLCRCTGYAGIKRAIRRLCADFDPAEAKPENRIADGLKRQWLPAYFAGIAEQLAALQAQEAFGGDEAGIPVGGGTDLMVHGEISARRLRFLPSCEQPVAESGDGRQCLITATATIEQLRTSPVIQNLLPSIAEDLKWLCSAPIRQSATLGGNLANASPIADLAVMFLALDASLVLENQDKQRSLPLRDFFIGYKQTACEPGETIKAIVFAKREAASGFSFEKVGKREFLDIAAVNSALAVRLSCGAIESVHIAAGGVAAMPLYLAATCDYLRGKAVKPETVLAAAAIAQTEFSPISDLRGTAEYKRLLFRQLFFAHFLKLFPEQIRWEALHALG